MRLIFLIVLVAMPWLLGIGLWIHDWRVIVGSIVAFVGVLAAELFDEIPDEMIEGHRGR